MIPCPTSCSILHHSILLPPWELLTLSFGPFALSHLATKIAPSSFLLLSALFALNSASHCTMKAVDKLSWPPTLGPPDGLPLDQLLSKLCSHFFSVHSLVLSTVREARFSSCNFSYAKTLRVTIIEEMNVFTIDSGASQHLWRFWKLPTYLTLIVSSAKLKTIHSKLTSIVNWFFSFPSPTALFFNNLG